MTWVNGLPRLGSLVDRRETRMKNGCVGWLPVGPGEHFDRASALRRSNTPHGQWRRKGRSHEYGRKNLPSWPSSRGGDATQGNVDSARDACIGRSSRWSSGQRVGGAIVGLEISLVALTLVGCTLSRARDGQTARLGRGTFIFIGEGMWPQARLYSMSEGGTDLHVVPTGELILFAAAPSPNGERIALLAAEPPSKVFGVGQLYLMNADGSARERIPACPREGCHGTSLSWSPDGRTLLFSGLAPGIHAVDLETCETRRLTGGTDEYAVWSPDGRRIAFARSEYRPYENAQIWVGNANGTDARQVTSSAVAHVATTPSWSPNGARIAYESFGGPDVQGGISLVTAGGSAVRQLSACVSRGCHESPTFPVWSPNGSSIAVLLLDNGEIQKTTIAVIDPETGDIRVVRVLPFMASHLSWER